MMDADQVVSLLDEIAPTVRPGQQRMLRAAHGVLHHRMQASVKAPTGIGKSWVALLAAAASEGRTVISTGTLLLQRQYATEDIPTVVAALNARGVNLTATVIKGRRNYGCLAQAAAVVEDGASEDQPSETAVRIETAARWVLDTESGDWSDAPFEAGPAVREALTVDSDSCLRKRCPHFDGCHFERVKNRADQSHIVLCNHAYFVANAVTGGALLPDHDNVIIDEAHKLEDFAIGAFSHELTCHRSRRGTEGGSLVRLGQLLGRVDVMDGGRLSIELAELSGRIHEWTDRTIGVRKGEVMFPAARQDPGLGRLLAKLDTVLDAADVVLSAAVPDDDAPPKVALAWRKASSAYQAARMFLHSLEVTTPGIVTYLARDGETGVAIRSSDVDVAKYLRPIAWTAPDGRPRGVLFTSATIPDGYPTRMGLIDAEEGAVPSPFDLAANLIAYVADDLPPATFRHRERWEPHAITRAFELADTALQVGGVLVLCSSLAQASTFARHLAPLARAHHGVTLVVDDGKTDKDAIVDQLRRVRRPLFIGSRGFYEGLNLPRKLRCVIVPTIPFAVPGDPIGEARRSLWPSDAWNHPIDLANTRCAIEQMVGRLIRCDDDRGVVAFLDKRIATDELRGALPDGVTLVDHRYGSAVLRWLLDSQVAA